MQERWFAKDPSVRGAGIRCLDQDVQILATHNFGRPEIVGHIAVVSYHDKILVFSGVRDSIKDRDGNFLLHPRQSKGWGYIWYDVHFRKHSGPVYDKSLAGQEYVSSGWETDEDLRLTIV